MSLLEMKFEFSGKVYMNKSHTTDNLKQNQEDHPTACSVNNLHVFFLKKKRNYKDF